MATDSKLQYTPPGFAAWVKVYEPDYTFKENGEWAVDLYLKEEYAKPMIKIYEDTIKDVIKENKGKGKPSPDVMYGLASEMKQEHLDKLKEQGFTPDPSWYRFKFRQNFLVKPKGGTEFTNKVKVYDDNKEVREHNRDEEIGHGAKVRVAYEPYGWCVSGKVGCKLRLVGVQVLDNPNPYGSSGTAPVNFEEDIPF
jgi:hypothetical protein